MYKKETTDRLILEGADKSLFEMPAIMERLVQRYSFNTEDIKVNEDGTFSTKEFDISRDLTENQKQKGYVFKISKKFKKEYHSNPALDAPFSVDPDYKSTFERDAELITYINAQGIEMEAVEMVSDHVQTTKIRKDGIITVTEGEKQEEFFDNGNWDLDNKGLFNENGNIKLDKDSASFTKAIGNFKENEKKIVEKYPHLKDWEDSGKKTMIRAFNDKGNEELENLRKENERLKENNERLQQMLEKSLSFAQTVRDSAVGKLFFGKKAKEVLGENDKNVKLLSDDNER